MTTTARNADPAELAKFAALAQSWWDPKGTSKPLHDLNPLRLHYAQNITPLAGKSICDVGCGGGILSESMARQDARVLGIDLAQPLLDIAELHALEAQVAVEYRCIAVEDLAAERPMAFDIVTCMEMLEHVPDPAAIVQALARLVKPAGHVLLSTLNRNPRAFAVAIVGAEYVARVLPRGTHEYLKFIRPSELARWGRNAGLELQDLTGITYNPFTRSFHLSADTGVNYLGSLSRGRLMGTALRTVLFDLDGTLLDTAPDMVGALNALRVHEQRPPLPYEEARALVSHGAGRLVKLGFPDADAEFTLNLQQRFLELYRGALSVHTRLFDGMDQVLGQLPTRGLLCGIVTNKPAWLTLPLLDQLGLTATFACVVSGDSVSERKPHAMPMRHAAALAGVKPHECLYVGDAERDIQAAHAADMRALVATYGYLEPDEDWQAWGAEGSIGTPIDLLDWLDRDARR